MSGGTAAATAIKVFFSFVCWSILFCASSGDDSVATPPGNLFELFKETLTLWSGAGAMREQIKANCPQLFALSDAQFRKENSTFLGSLETLEKLCSAQSSVELSGICQGAIGVSNYLCDLSNDIRQQDASQALPKPAKEIADPKQWIDQSSLCKSLDDSDQLVTFIDNVSKYSNPNARPSSGTQIRTGAADNCLTMCNGTSFVLCRMILVGMKTSLQFADLLESALQQKEVSSAVSAAKSPVSTTVSSNDKTTVVTTSSTVAKASAVTGTTDQKEGSSDNAEGENEVEKTDNRIDEAAEENEGNPTAALGENEENANDISEKTGDDRISVQQKEGEIGVTAPPDLVKDAPESADQRQVADETIDDNGALEGEKRTSERKEGTAEVIDKTVDGEDAKVVEAHVESQNSAVEPSGDNGTKEDKASIESTVDRGTDNDLPPETPEEASKDINPPSENEEMKASDNKEDGAEDAAGKEAANEQKESGKDAPDNQDAIDEQVPAPGVKPSSSQDGEADIEAGDDVDGAEGVVQQENGDEGAEVSVEKEEIDADVDDSREAKVQEDEAVLKEEADLSEANAAVDAKSNPKAVDDEETAFDEELPVEEAVVLGDDGAADDRDRYLADEEDADDAIEDALIRTDRKPSPRIISHKVIYDRYMHEPQDTHFLLYFIVCAVFSFTGYVILMRWNRIVPLVIRRSGPSVVRRGRSNRSYWLLSSRYRKLVNNLEEVVSPTQSVKTSSYIY